jgi:hypothetical protein
MKAALCGLSVASAIVIVGMTSHAQSFDSGSDESDGPLTLAANLGTVVFDPFEQSRWGKVLDPDGDGVYNFTTITINSGTTLKLRGDKVNRPMYWLAFGNVVINGTIDLMARTVKLTFEASICDERWPSQVQAGTQEAQVGD